MDIDYTDPRAVLAHTLFGEIRGGDQAAKQHVASVILNRVKHPSWWGKTIVSVCLDRMQFSCWWLNDSNRQAMLEVGQSDPTYLACDTVAADAIAGELLDATKGADSYFALSSPAPAWAGRARLTITDGFHAFYQVQASDVVQAADPGAPTVSTHVIAQNVRADDLNELELQRLRESRTLQGGLS